jgi:aryl-alcohol dehydrogenase-like predicted oxidoreductase
VEGHIGGESERIIGAWLQDRGLKGKILVATKVGYETQVGSGLSRRQISASIDESLARLSVDCIDIYQLHRADPHVPVEETIEALLHLHKAGKIRAIGFCNMPADTLRCYIQTAREAGLYAIASYQGKLNYLERERVSKNLYEIIWENRLIFLVYGVLARGFLTGKYQHRFDPAVSVRSHSVYRKYYNETYLSQLDSFLSEADAAGKTPVQAAYEWVEHELSCNRINSVLIGGFTSNWQLKAAVEILSLSL